jgi:hypothetical protein
MAQRFGRLAPASDGEGLQHADPGNYLGIFIGPDVAQRGENSLGRPVIAAQRGQPASLDGQIFEIRQRVGVRVRREFGAGGPGPPRA